MKDPDSKVLIGSFFLVSEMDLGFRKLKFFIVPSSPAFMSAQQWTLSSVPCYCMHLSRINTPVASP